MTKKISELPVAVSVGTTHEVELNQAGVSRSGTLLQLGELEVPTQTATTIVTDNIQENTLSNGVFCNSVFKVDSIISNAIDSTVNVEGCSFETTGTSTYAQFGNSATQNTLDTTLHLQSKRDVYLFLEADTDDVASGDIPVQVVTNNANDDMLRIMMDSALGDVTIDLGSASHTPGITFKTGGDYVTAPATGTIPDYVGVGKTEPTEALFISGTTQEVQVFQDLYVGTSSSDASAKVQIDSTTQGFLPPRMTSAERTAIVSPATGLMVFDTTSNQWFGYNGTTWVILG